MQLPGQRQPVEKPYPKKEISVRPFPVTGQGQAPDQFGVRLTTKQAAKPSKGLAKRSALRPVHHVGLTASDGNVRACSVTSASSSLSAEGRLNQKNRKKKPKRNPMPVTPIRRSMDFTL